MRRELDYFSIDGSYGWQQDWFSRYLMRLGGCAAVTACDSCVYLKKYRGYSRLYPYSVNLLTRAEYLRFSDTMRPYLHPRWQGINTLKIYLDGFGQYLRDVGESRLQLLPFPGDRPVQAAQQVIQEQIDLGFPIPCLLLRHRKPALQDYVWHWFLLTGYEQFEDVFLVKVVTYGTWRWIDLAELWNTGYRKRGGLILFRERTELI